MPVFVFLRLGARPHPGPDHPRGHRAPLLGALGGLPDVLVNREAGGTGAIIGIVWLAPIFAVWFGRKHAQAG